MKCVQAVAFPALLVSAHAGQAESNPLGTVFELMSALEAKIIKEGEAEAKAFKADWKTRWLDGFIESSGSKL